MVLTGATSTTPAPTRLRRRVLAELRPDRVVRRATSKRCDADDLGPGAVPLAGASPHVSQ
jgi:hypothetical protein